MSVEQGDLKIKLKIIPDSSRTRTKSGIIPEFVRRRLWDVNPESGIIIVALGAQVILF